MQDADARQRCGACILAPGHGRSPDQRCVFTSSHPLPPSARACHSLRRADLALARQVAYKSTLDCLVRTVRDEGVINGLFRGHSSTLMRELPGNVSWFGGESALSLGRCCVSFSLRDSEFHLSADALHCRVRGWVLSPHAGRKLER